MFILYGWALVTGLLLLILAIRFLWMVPNELNEIKFILKYRLKTLVEKSVVEFGEDVKMDPAIVKKVESQLQSDFENSSTLQ